VCEREREGERERERERETDLTPGTDNDYLCKEDKRQSARLRTKSKPLMLEMRDYESEMKVKVFIFQAFNTKAQNNHKLLHFIYQQISVQRNKYT
jgi:hypothetical protein